MTAREHLPLPVNRGGRREWPESSPFDDRVKAQEAIERAYYSHQIGATKPFEEAIPRLILERKVKLYLEQTMALSRFWRTSITGEMLQHELERMARDTRLPKRLEELYS